MNEPTDSGQSILHSLIHYPAWVNAQTKTEVVHKLLNSEHKDFIAVKDNENLIGLVSKKKLGTLLGQRYGIDLYGSRPINEHMLDHVLVVKDITDLEEILNEVFSRPSQILFDDILLTDQQHRFLGLIQASSLMSIQHKMLKENLRAVEAHKTELEDKNRELETLAHQLSLTNKELESANQAAISATRHKSEFLANMSHEIRTPMNGIIGMTNLLLESSLSQYQQSLAHTVQDSAESLLRIINDILDFSRVEAGKLDIQYDTFDLVEIIESSLLLISEQALKKGVELILDLPADFPDRIISDGSRIRQILLNLVSNSAKFTEGGHICIRARIKTTPALKSSIYFEIEDTGCGIPPNLAYDLFAPFKQVDGSSTRQHGGTGLGLSICKSLVKLMHGDIGYTSEQGIRTTFWFSLPLIQADKESNILSSFHFNKPVLFLEPNSLKSLNVIRLQLQSVAPHTHATDSLIEATSLIETNNYHSIIVSLSTKSEQNITQWLNQIRSINAASPSKQIIILRPFGYPINEQSFASLHCPVKIFNKPLRKSDLPLLFNTDPIAPPPLTLPRSNTQKPPSPSVPQRNDPILIVEDIETNRRVIQLLLNHMGYSFETAANGREALTWLQNKQFALILMDCQMPVMDGYEATRRIRTDASGINDSQIPIIAMTANAMKGDRERCLDAGMDLHLPKPVRKNDLSSTLQSFLGPYPQTKRILASQIPTPV